MKNIKIELKNISKKFDRRVVLSNINLNIYENEIFGIFGPSGCGKTTLLRIIAGLERPDNGEVYLNGKLVSSKTYFENPEDRDVSLVFQDLGLWPHLTVEEHIEFVLDKYENVDKKKRIKELLKMVNLEENRNKKPEELSGGEKQRLAIARALAKEASILLLDEPLTSLDIYIREDIKKILLKLKKNLGMTIIIVTHDILDLVNLCERIAIITNGKVERVLKPKEFLAYIKKKIKF